MRAPSRNLSPPSSLLPVRSIRTATQDEISSALRNLREVYCPLRLPPISSTAVTPKKSILMTDAFVDSGYASPAVEEEVALSNQQDLDLIRTDAFERQLAIRWLTSLIGQVEELQIDNEETKAHILDEAAFVLAFFSDTPEPEDNGEAEALTRDFTFHTSISHPSPVKIEVQLNDAPLSGIDHTDVGLQSWGASIILSELLCSIPERFGLTKLQPASTIVELGAGTGLVGLTLGLLLSHTLSHNPTIVATDYHEAVLKNLRSNIAVNFPAGQAPIQTMHLDWSAPHLETPLDNPVDIIVAADVVYAPEHAMWLRDCVARMLAKEGVFWLMTTIRSVGKFEGIPETVEKAFRPGNCPKENGCILQIRQKERLEKKRGIGRGDERGYMLYKIGWESS